MKKRLWIARLKTDMLTMAALVAQMAELLIPTLEVGSSNLGISKFVIEHLFNANCIEKTKIKKKGREWPIF